MWPSLCLRDFETGLDWMETAYVKALSSVQTMHGHNLCWQTTVQSKLIGSSLRASGQQVRRPPELTLDAVYLHACTHAQLASIVASRSGCSAVGPGNLGRLASSLAHIDVLIAETNYWTENFSCRPCGHLLMLAATATCIRP